MQIHKIENSNKDDAQVFYTNCASFHNTFTNNFFPLRKSRYNQSYSVEEFNAAHFKFTIIY